MTKDDLTRNTRNPKLFISYSWTSPQHEAWVMQLATELRESSVDVILDKWDLKEGHDANAFMEKMVSDPNIRKVVLVCDKKYAEKADSRSGGAGTEAQIISPEIYKKEAQDKFVAVVAEKDENGNPHLPIYYKSRIYIDLSDINEYAKNFEQLLRWIFDKPMHTKPELGAKPAFLDETAPISLGTAARFSRVLDSIRNNRPYTSGALREYFETFGANLEKFRIVRREGAFDDQVVENIEQFIPYRNQSIEIFLAIGQYFNKKESHDQLHHFFEQLIPYLDRPANVESWREVDFDNFKFIIHELFLYCVASLLKHGAYDAVAYLLNNRYFVENNSEYTRNGMQGYNLFMAYLHSLEYRNSRLNLRQLSVHASLLNDRSNGTGLSFELIMQADFLLFIRDCVDSTVQGSAQYWWPVTLVYKADRNRPFEIFARAESTQFFQQLAPMLGIKTKAELNSILAAFEQGKLRIPRWDFRFVNPSVLLGIDSLATRP